MDDRFCVYLHKSPEDGSVFYVGQGTPRRPYASCKYTRSKAWLEKVQSFGGFIVEIVKENLSKAEAIYLESELINRYQTINSKHNTSQRRLSDTEISSILDNIVYCEGSQSGIRWKISGKVAGSIITTNNKSYWRVQINGKSYRVHRIIKILETGKDISENMVVNHKDGNGLNNKIENLEICSQQENMKDVNTRNSKHRGVKYNKKSNAWVAYWQENLVRKSKTFSVSKYGDDSYRLACEYRKSKI